MDVRQFVRPIFTAMLLCMLGYFSLAGFLAYLQDKSSIAAERQKLQSVMDQYCRTLELLAEDNAWWDAAVKNVVLEYDERWLIESIAETTYTYNRVVGVVVVGTDGDPIFSHIKDGLPSEIEFLNMGLWQALRTQELPEIDQPQSTKGMLVHDGRLYAFGASMFTTGLGYASNVSESFFSSPRPVLVFISEITPAILAEVGTEYTLEQLQYHGADKARSPNIDLGLTPLGEPVGRISWSPTRAGTDLLITLVWPTLGMLLIIGFLSRKFLAQVRETLAKVEAADRAKSEFLASTSHEVRTPLNAIIGFSEILSLEMFGKVEGEKNKQYVQLIRESGAHLLSIINDILDMSKLEAGGFEMFPKMLHIKEIVSSSEEFIHTMAEDKNIQVSMTVENADIFADERVTRQVLLNILSNAVKYTPEGGHIRVTGDVSPPWYTLSVADDGPGMTEDQLEKALELFGQVPTGLETKHAGTGLGLPLVVRFMRLMEGRFDIRSAPGEGTCVTLKFPMEKAKENV
ncbi:MAG: hypothetical protein HWE25_16855 [Alphaproteobacteria bacterium]|nr:hypothetical protein [Alphaproteobacteria bacterium]